MHSARTAYRSLRAVYRKVRAIKNGILNLVDSPIIILIYHRVTELQSDPEMLAVSPENFRLHMEFLKQQYEVGNVEEQVWLRWAQTMDFWFSFPGVKAYWAGRATPYTDGFTTYIEQRLANNDYTFNIENYNNYMRTGKIPAR